MSRLFKSYMGKNTFEVNKESQDAGQYTNNKTASSTFCSPNVCVPSRTVINQSNRLLLKKANRIYFSGCNSIYNIGNLNINLVTKLNLTGIPVIKQNNPSETPTNLNVSSIPYLTYTIDPSGNLFGNTVCGSDNFQNYLQYNPPYSTTAYNYINRV